MNFTNLIRNLLGLQRKIDLDKLPSQNFFYKDDFEIYIKKVDSKDIQEYESDFVKDDLGKIIGKLKKVVSNNIQLSSNYTFNDLKSIDVVFLFLEIVKFTKGRDINIKYFNSHTGIDEFIPFGSKYFNYFIIDDDILKLWNSTTKQFFIDGYKFSLPSIGVENGLTSYLISISGQVDVMKYNSYSYDFTFFLSDKNDLSPNEVENLIEIFNFDMNTEEKNKVRKIVNYFSPLQKYSLKRGSQVIELNAQIDLEKIWRD